MDGHSSRHSVQSLTRVGADIAPGAALEILRQEGVLIIESALDAPSLEQICGELDPWFDRTPFGSGQFFGRATRRFGGIFAKSINATTLAIHPLVLGLMNSVLRNDDTGRSVCDAIELNLTQAIDIHPGEPAQFLHRDEELWPFQHGYELMTNAMWALDDFTAENGATRLIPGSHKWPRDRVPQVGEALSAVAPAGSAILWLGGVLHGGGANMSNCPRRGVVMSYRLAWLASGERLLLSTPPEVARRLPEALQRLIGYQVHRPNLGWVEGQDPIHWLRGEVRDTASCHDNLTTAHESLLADVESNRDGYAGYLQ